MTPLQHLLHRFLGWQYVRVTIPGREPRVYRVRFDDKFWAVPEMFVKTDDGSLVLHDDKRVWLPSGKVGTWEPAS